jgi:alpha-beta hydrolase superfamily lysophospholipase
MLHGFGIHSGRHREAAATFARAGLSVTAFDCRGHGLSTGRRGYVHRFTDYVDDLHAVIESARGMDVGSPVAVVGHSQGGTIALDYALRNPARLSALMLASPWLALKLKVPFWKLALSKVVGKVWPTLTLGNELSSEITIRAPEVRARWDNDPLAHHVATPRWFNEVRAVQAYILGHPSTLRVPTFMGVSGDDRLVSTEAALSFARAAPAVEQVKVFERAFHELFMEPNFESIVEDFASWVVARLSAPYT